MRMTETLEQRAVSRSTDEIGRAILYLRALRGLSRADSYHAVDFVRLAYWALYDQLFAHVIRVLGPREQAGFWFLVKKHKNACAEFCTRANVSLDHVTAIEKKLSHIRNKALFHLDRAGVLDPSRIWEEADLTFGELERAMNASFSLLCFLFEELRGAPYTLPDYDGSDATALAEYTYRTKLPTTGYTPHLSPATTATAVSTK
jgi:hypothetical protein